MSLKRIIPVVVLALAVFAGCGEDKENDKAKTGKDGESTSKKEDSRSCEKLGINVRGGKTGTCIRNKKRVTVVNRGDTLQLRELAVRVGKVKANRSLRGPLGAVEPEKGRIFITAVLTVRNKLTKPAKFDDGFKQVRLRVAGGGFPPSEQGEAAVPNSFFNQDRRIAPKKTQTGSVVLQAKAGVAKALRRRGADPSIFIWNFSEEPSKGPPNGVIRLWK